MGGRGEREDPQRKQQTTRKDALRRKTNEAMKQKRLVQVEKASEELLDQLEEVREGDLYQVEHILLTDGGGTKRERRASH